MCAPLSMQLSRPLRHRPLFAPHHHHLGGLASVHTREGRKGCITVNHVFIGNSISLTHWDDLYSDTGSISASELQLKLKKK